MKNLLTEFRFEFRTRLLDLLWRQWTSLGVSGHGRPWIGSVIDPDALLVFSSTITRHDARLFDAVLEWLRINGRFVNVQRMKRMLKEEHFSGEPVLGAMAAATKTSVNEAKWAALTNTSSKKQKDSLFYLSDGNPLPVVREPDSRFAEYGYLRDRYDRRDVAEPFRPEPPGNLLLRLRALLGVNARCEILLYLLLNNRGSPRAMARDCSYFPATISKVLAEMKQSGFLVSRIDGRHHYYTLIPATWKDLFMGNESPCCWIVWARLFSALEQVWLFLDRQDLADESALAQASPLRRMLKRSVISQFERSGIGFVFGDDAAHPGEALIPFFMSQMRELLDRVEQLTEG